MPEVNRKSDNKKISWFCKKYSAAYFLKGGMSVPLIQLGQVLLIESWDKQIPRKPFPASLQKQSSTQKKDEISRTQGNYL